MDDMAGASVFDMNLAPDNYATQVQAQLSHINAGYGAVNITELAAMVARVTGYSGRITFYASKPDGAPRKLMDSTRLVVLGWRAEVDLTRRLQQADIEMQATNAVG